MGLLIDFILIAGLFVGSLVSVAIGFALGGWMALSAAEWLEAWARRRRVAKIARELGEPDSWT